MIESTLAELLTELMIGKTKRQQKVSGSIPTALTNDFSEVCVY